MDLHVAAGSQPPFAAETRWSWSELGSAQDGVADALQCRTNTRTTRLEVASSDPAGCRGPRATGA